MEIAVIMLLGAILNGLLASSRGRPVPGWALLGAFFPLISLLILVLLPDLKAEQSAATQLAEANHQRQLAELRAEMAADTKTCPRCAENVKFAALVCRYCGHEFAQVPPSRAAIEGLKALDVELNRQEVAENDQADERYRGPVF